MLKPQPLPKVLTLHGIQVPAEDYHTLCRLTAILYGKTYAAAMSPEAAQREAARYALEILQEWRRRQRARLQEVLGEERAEKGDVV